MAARENPRRKDVDYLAYWLVKTHLGFCDRERGNDDRRSCMIVNRNDTSGSSRLRTLLCLFLFIASGIGVMCATGIGERESRNAFGIASQSSKIARWVIQHTANGQQAEFFVVLADQADLSGAAVLATKV